MFFILQLLTPSDSFISSTAPYRPSGTLLLGELNLHLHEFLQHACLSPEIQSSLGKKKKVNNFPSHEKMSSNMTLSGGAALRNITCSADKSQYPGAPPPTAQGGIFQHQLETKLESDRQDEEAKMRKGRKHQTQGEHQTKCKSPDRNIKAKRVRSMNQNRFRMALGDPAWHRGWTR